MIGPGRSGTSITMRVLNLLGVYIGPEEDLVAPGPGGPKGFWERLDMMEIDDRLLRSQGGSWRSPPQLAPGWQASPELDAERARARALLSGAFGDRGLWGWKNPRASLTTPFWLDLVPDLRFVVCLRNPVDFASSIAPPAEAGKGDGFYFSRRGPRGEHAFRHWLAYTAAALANTAGRPRVLVAYEEHFEGRRAVVERLARFLGRESPAPGGELDRRIDDYVDARLRHHSTPPEDVLRDGRLPPEVAALYLATELLRRAAPVPGVMPDPGFERLDDAVGLYCRRLLDAGAGRVGRRDGGLRLRHLGGARAP